MHGNCAPTFTAWCPILRGDDNVRRRCTLLSPRHCLPCAGAKIEDRFLVARDPSGVQPPGHLPGVSGAEAAMHADGSMQGTIKARWDWLYSVVLVGVACPHLSFGHSEHSGPGCARPELAAARAASGRPMQVQLDSAAASSPAFPIICAAGPVDSGGASCMCAMPFLHVCHALLPPTSMLGLTTFGSQPMHCAGPVSTHAAPAMCSLPQPASRSTTAPVGARPPSTLPLARAAAWRACLPASGR